MTDIRHLLGMPAFLGNGHALPIKGKSDLPIGRLQKSRFETGFRENPDFRQRQIGSCGWTPLL